MPPSSVAAVEKRAAAWPDGEAVYRARFDERVSRSQAVYLFLVIPLLAAPLFAFLRGRRRYLAEHLLFATELVTFLLLTLFGFGLGALIFQRLLPGGAAMVAVLALVGFWLILMIGGVIAGVRRFYRLSWWLALPLGVAVTWWWGLTTWVYGKAIFWLTFWSLRP